MREKCTIETESFSGEAVIRANSRTINIEYEEEPSGIFGLYFVLSIALCWYLISSQPGDFEFKQILGGILIVVMLQTLPLLFSRLIPPLKKVFFNYKTMSLAKDVVFARTFVTETEKASAAGIASILGSAAMSGSLRDQGNRAGSRFWLGVAALTPSKKLKKSFGVELLDVDRSLATIYCKKQTAQRISDFVDNIDPDCLSLFFKHAQDLQQAPDKASEEIQEALSSLKGKIRVLEDQSKNGDSSTERNKAHKDLNQALAREKVFLRLRVLCPEKPTVVTSKESTNSEQDAAEPIDGKPLSDVKTNSKLSKYAVTSTVFGLGSVLAVPAPFAIIFGLLGLKDVSQNAKRGKGLAYFGLVLGIAFLCFWIVAWPDAQKNQ